jgi:two-component system chemotaxis response regulator CheY
MAKTVLCIDDSPTIRLLVKKTLEPLGYQILEAEDGQKGLDLAAKNTVDFFLVDVNMPVTNGIECVKGLKARPASAKTPVVFLTTESSEEKKAQGRQLGVNGWMVKPFEAEALVKIVRMLAG